ncbi:hypothetical protein STSP2_02379 [Anaerohalosphaera lusitana]|uniref:Fibronectin type-III domain-containing protein n=1 Tax=Anaerohalosphaera lusitana TaxID=1936003 RepID=A0A1U9NML1_9BACT|nr:fibronectin type III domain-containing protein [Anaerohalosphaera lusitana]AQT69192.1 hypothetical protein STSP2_02379 [Anaerohalosphaera lusitana]
MLKYGVLAAAVVWMSVSSLMADVIELPDSKGHTGSYSVTAELGRKVSGVYYVAAQVTFSNLAGAPSVFNLLELTQGSEQKAGFGQAWGAGTWGIFADGRTGSDIPLTQKTTLCVFKMDGSKGVADLWVDANLYGSEPSKGDVRRRISSIEADTVRFRGGHDDNPVVVDYENIRIYCDGESPFGRLGVKEVYPARGTIDVDRDIDLRWDRPSGVKPESYRLYFRADDADFGDSRGNTVDGISLSAVDARTSYDVGRLDENTTYYWRVDILADGKTYEGDTLSFSVPLRTQQGEWQLTLNNNGIISCQSPAGKIDFRSDSYAGPQWYMYVDGTLADVPMQLSDSKDCSFAGESGNIAFKLNYNVVDGKLALTAKARNKGTDKLSDLRAGLRLGVDSYMVSYPEWDEKYFPTLLRCEKTHFWGYGMTPDRRILGWSSPDPIASYTINYEQHRHRIYTVSLDLLNPGPLPERHPQELDTLSPGEQKEWTLFLEPIESLEDVKPQLASTTGGAMFDIEHYTVAEGEKVEGNVYSPQPIELKVQTPSGMIKSVPVVNRKNAYAFRYQPDDGMGVYTLTASTPQGKVSEAMVSVRRPWSWYLKKARENIVAQPPKVSLSVECWYGLFSMFLAREYFPDPLVDAKCEQKFQEMFPLIYNQETDLVYYSGRIQNAALTASMMVDRYQATGNLDDLEIAVNLADYLIKRQGDDGAYYSGGGVHYTSVIYIAKSMLELAIVEEELALDSELWKERYERHYNSAKRAIDDLARRGANVQTEGQQTYEDGMISCSATQLAYFALMQSDPAERARYTKVAKELLLDHSCLTQLLIPDSRMNGATLRFWETQYNLKLTPNMMNSPCGWSVWRTYGLWYMYLLTGEEDWLRQTYNSLGTCVQVVDPDTGKLRWGFVADPYVEARVFKPKPDSPGEGMFVNEVIGEGYRDMIAGWFLAPPCDYAKSNIGATDGLVHEIFKCLEEVALTTAHVVERENGELVGYNCTVEEKGGVVHIVPSEDLVTRIHLNFEREHRIDAEFGGGEKVQGKYKGMSWIGPGGAPDGFASGSM